MRHSLHKILSILIILIIYSLGVGLLVVDLIPILFEMLGMGIGIKKDIG